MNRQQLLLLGSLLRSATWLPTDVLVVQHIKSDVQLITRRLKNQQSKLFQQLHNFRTRQRTLLTGTPLQNNLSELWMLLHFLDASKFQSLQDFEADFSDFSHGDQVYLAACV